MQRIIISESDLTSNVEIMSSYDVAYVPGFMFASDSDIMKYYRKPTLFTNKYDFVAKIGSTVPTFNNAQYYPVFVANQSDGFTKKAIPDGGVMFAPGDADLGYRIALYLLNLGIPVYYEVMNNTTSGNLQSIYTYSKIDATQEVFNPSITYYRTSNTAGETFDYSTNITPDSAVTVTKNTFVTKVGKKDGTYVFSGSVVSDALTWTLNDEVVDIAQYGIVVANTFTPDASVTYTITVSYEYATADEVTQTDIAPGTTGSWFEEAENITSFDPNVSYYTLTVTENAPITVPAMYAGLKNRFIDAPNSADSSFDSVGDYSVKYITSGGYPTFEYCFQASGSAYPLMTGMIELAAARGDAIALIDHTNNPTRDLYPSTLGGSGNAVIDVIRAMGANIDAGDFAAMFTPWYECSHGAITSGASSAFVPASVAYLSALAVQLRNYNPWLAVSGVTRGKVPNLVTSDSSDTLHTVARLTNNIADAYQTLPTDAGITQVSINPITYIRNVGYCIWGNRTLRNNNVGTSALSFLNVRGIVSDIKKLIYEACQTNLFEQNTDITWINFKSVITPLLDRMTSNYVLQDYSITRYMIDPVTGENVPAYKVLAVIRIQPINSIEVFDLTVQLENAEVVVAEI